MYTLTMGTEFYGIFADNILKFMNYAEF